MDIDNAKIPPNSVDSEQSVLGGLLLHNDSWDSVVNILGSDDFYQTSHRIIYDAIVTLLEHDKPADILTVKEQVIKSHDEASIGGFAYLAQIAENTPSVSNIEAYAKHVRELSIYRQLTKIGKELADTAFNPKDIEVNDLLDLSERKIFEIAEQVSRNKQEITNVKDIIKDVDGELRPKAGFDRETFNPDQNALLQQGYIEQSNVNVFEELVANTDLMKRFQLNTKLISIAKDLDESSASLLRMPNG